MLVENHKIRLRESFDMIALCVARELEEVQRTLGFHLSAAAVDLLNLYLHQADLVESTSDLNHRRMRSARMLEEALPFDFPNKDEIIRLLCAVEGARDGLCYGRPQKAPVIEQALADFAALRRLFREMGAHEG